MSRGRPAKAELAWWLGVTAWVAMALLWAPEPPVSYLDVPSASPRPPGFAIFHDMVERQVPRVRRILGSASMMPDDVGVLVVLSPTRPVPEAHREEMLEWVSSSGGTLIVAHPVRGEDGVSVSAFVEDGMWPISEWAKADVAEADILAYTPIAADPPREVEPFEFPLRQEMKLAEYGAEAMLSGLAGTVVVSSERYGAGTVIQLAEAAMLDNRALGRKRTHLFAAALIDEAGRDAVWAFDEAHEGVDTEPSLISYLGSGRWRAVTLHVMLLLLFSYWWATSRLGRRASIAPAVDKREVTSLARDVGDFYFRAGRSAWALSRTLELFKTALKTRGAAGEQREEALELARQAQAELDGGAGSADRNVALIRKMALSQRGLARSKGKKK